MSINDRHKPVALLTDHDLRLTLLRHQLAHKVPPLITQVACVIPPTVSGPGRQLAVARVVLVVLALGCYEHEGASIGFYDSLWCRTFPCQHAM